MQDSLPRAVDREHVFAKPYTFRRLLDAQSAGDVQALRARDRRVARVRLSDLEEVS